MATANSIVAASSYIGAGFCSLSVLLIDRVGWRQTLQTIGNFGVAVGLLNLLFVKEPKRGMFNQTQIEETPQIEEEKQPYSFDQVQSAMKKVISKPVIRFCTLGAMFRFFEQYAIDYYLPVYFLKQFP